MVLGVSRSGTTLLKEMLDRHSELAIPTESYFIPQLWDRHRGRGSDGLVEDLGKIARVREWGVTPEDVRRRVGTDASFAEVIRAVYESYAESHGKKRFGDKTPAYMQHLELLERVFPGAQYVHIVRDGRDAALSFVSMRRRPRFNWARPRGLYDFAAAWRYEIEVARDFAAATVPGRYFELRYEDLVAEPEPRLHEICGFLGLDFEPAILDYHRTVDPSRLQDHPRLAEPPKQKVRRWQEEMRPADNEVFEAIAGELLAALGYERAFPTPSATARTRAATVEAAYSVRLLSWRASVALARRSPAWRIRQAYIRRTADAPPV
ncbi:MAG: sulfotransferase [Actinomycetota bacterium]|nr:sulfotransferase [Actinomycetota bacterium]